MKTFFLTLATLLYLHGSAYAEEAKKLSNDKWSQVVVSKKKEGAKTNLFFKVNVGQGIKYNWDGPWKLKLSAAGMEKVVKGTSDFDKSGGGFKADIPKGVKKVDYRLTAFICTKDKKRCFREVHKASVNI